MNLKNSLASLILITIIATATFALATPIKEYLFPSSGTITETKATLYVDMVLFPNGTLIEWFDMARGETHYVNFTVQNTGTTTFNVTLEITNIPTGITYKWLANNTQLAPGEYAEANLDLTVGSTATLGTYSMGTYHVILKEA